MAVGRGKSESVEGGLITQLRRRCSEACEELLLGILDVSWYLITLAYITYLASPSLLGDLRNFLATTRSLR
ncbi:hypothetical protein L484_011266 [Morus notabilis]|uniref:Uncharacterized protein n=1 Tax=Morus notabilis TaxID=981085 RepID=W9RR05_9ROSA|nr:hypothetical protein L484_011266 [Morus notabilis]